MILYNFIKYTGKFFLVAICIFSDCMIYCCSSSTVLAAGLLSTDEGKNLIINAQGDVIRLLVIEFGEGNFSYFV
jgi:hypothetical protein